MIFVIIQTKITIIYPKILMKSLNNILSPVLQNILIFNKSSDFFAHPRIHIWWVWSASQRCDRKRTDISKWHEILRFHDMGVWSKSMYPMTSLFIESTFEKIILKNLSPKYQREMDEYFNFHKTLDNVPLSFLTQKMLLDISVLITFIVIWFCTLTLIRVIFSIALYMTGNVNNVQL